MKEENKIMRSISAPSAINIVKRLIELGVNEKTLTETKENLKKLDKK